MSERYTAEEARREAQAMQKTKEERAAKGGQLFDAAEYELWSDRLDELRKSDPERYETALRLAGLAKDAESVRPKIQEAYRRVIAEDGDLGWREALARAEEIRSYLVEQHNSGRDSDSLRVEKVNEVIDECLKKQLETYEQHLALDEGLQSATSAELQKLKRYFLGPEVQSLWRRRATAMLTNALE